MRGEGTSASALHQKARDELLAKLLLKGRAKDVFDGMTDEEEWDENVDWCDFSFEGGLTPGVSLILADSVTASIDIGYHHSDPGIEFDLRCGQLTFRHSCYLLCAHVESSATERMAWQYWLIKLLEDEEGNDEELLVLTAIETPSYGAPVQLRLWNEVELAQAA